MTFRLQIRTWGWSRTFWSLLWPSRGRRGLLSDWYRDKHTSWPGRYRHNVQIGYLYNHTYWLGTYQIILRIYFVAQIFIGSSTMNVSIYSDYRQGIYEISCDTYFYVIVERMSELRKKTSNNTKNESLKKKGKPPDIWDLYFKKQWLNP
jgi:hypothetical protein